MAARAEVVVVDPSLPGRSGGNRVTALRWARMLRQLGLRVHRCVRYDGRPAQAMVALHAVRSAAAIDAFAARYPERLLVVAATGTDIHEPAARARVQQSLAQAQAIVVLQPHALGQLPAEVRARAHVILQSVRLPQAAPPPPSGVQVCVLANLRAVKDPLRAAYAARRLPASSRVRVVLLGGVVDDARDGAIAAAARDLMAREHRFAWLGSYPRAAALQMLRASWCLVNSSHSEGGANAVGEAIVAGVPPLITAIPGSLGLLGDDWPATFPVGDDGALATLLLRCERDAAWRAALQARLQALAPAFAPAVELSRWRSLLAPWLPVAP